MEFKQKTLWKVEPRAYQIRWRSTWRRRRRPEKAPTIRRLYGCAPYLGNENPPNLLPPPHGLFLPSHCLSAAVQKSQHFCTEQEKSLCLKRGELFWRNQNEFLPSFPEFEGFQSNARCPSLSPIQMNPRPRLDWKHRAEPFSPSSLNST